MDNNFPKRISVFPLRGAIFFPKTNLPLNIFEKRYVTMVEDALKSDKYIGMVQSKQVEGDVFKVGCLGKIDRHEKTSDGRILINLSGLSRFKIDSEINNDKLYREFIVNYDDFKEDTRLKEYTVKNEILEKLIDNSKKYFNQQGVLIDWKEISKLKAFEQIYTLAMISPFSVSEKQKVLEIPDLNEAARTLNEITKFGFYEDLNDKDTLQ
ncbi:LON peptidase substrate-binding domain-containing protein [Pelagibacteraceae bacterium]|nr:LON peptidase substrate-binding domain-containing protein [Pelagibacteraceae bacterium]